MIMLKLVVDNTNMVELGIDPAEMENLRNGFDDWIECQGPVQGFKPGEIWAFMGGRGRSHLAVKLKLDAEEQARQERLNEYRKD